MNERRRDLSPVAHGGKAPPHKADGMAPETSRSSPMATCTRSLFKIPLPCDTQPHASSGRLLVLYRSMSTRNQHHGRLGSTFRSVSGGALRPERRMDSSRENTFPPTNPSMHSFVGSFVRSFLHPLINSFIWSSAHPFVRLSVH